MHRKTKHNLPHDGDRSPAESGDKSPHSKSAFSLIELIVILCILGLLVFILIPSLANVRNKSRLIDCSGNLKQIGLAFRLWSPDSTSTYPMARSTNYGGSYCGTLEVSNLVWRSFQALSNELGTPLILTCPADTRAPVRRFETLQNTNISYFIGLDANDDWTPQLLLSGDHHLSNGRATTNKVLTIHINDSVRWMGRNHQGGGNIALADGSVQQPSSMRLQQSVAIALQDNWKANTNATLRLAMPE